MSQKTTQGDTGEKAALALPEEFLEKRKKQKRNKIIKVSSTAITAVVIIALVVTLLPKNESTDNAIAETGTYTQEVTKDTLELSVEGSGTLESGATATDSASVSGTVKKVYVSVGDEVEEGDTLYTLESDELEEAVSNASSALSEATSTYNSAVNAYNSAVTAYNKAKKSSSSSSSSSSTKQTSSTTSKSKSGSAPSESSNSSGSSSNGVSSSSSSSSSSSDTVSQAKQEVTSAKEAVTQAKSALTQAQEDYKDAVESTEDLTVKASMDGTVSSVGVSAGDTVNTGSGSGSGSGSADSSSSNGVTIVDNSSMTVTMQVSEYDIENIKKGQKATVTITALEKTVNAKVSEVAVSSTSSSSGSSSSSTSAYYDVVLKISKVASKMRSGMNVTTKIIYKSYEDVLLVPTSAISTDDDGNSTVTIEGNDGQTMQVSITVLGGTDEQSAVTGDLQEGDRVQVTYHVSSSDSNSNSQEGGMGGGMPNMGGDSSGGPTGGQGGDMGGGSGASGGPGGQGGGGGTPPSGN